MDESDGAGVCHVHAPSFGSHRLPFGLLLLAAVLCKWKSEWASGRVGVRVDGTSCRQGRERSEEAGERETSNPN
eukprot:5012222-Prymnesium_polylepis.1